MNREELVLTAMAPCGGYKFSPVQIQKLLFLIDKQVPEAVGGPHFNFQPYHYGPFDAEVYRALENLGVQGLVTIDPTRVPRVFALTIDGLSRGNDLIARLPRNIQLFLVGTSQFVRDQSFSSLVSAIYKAFPEMRANSVFQS